MVYGPSNCINGGLKVFRYDTVLDWKWWTFVFFQIQLFQQRRVAEWFLSLQNFVDLSRYLPEPKIYKGLDGRARKNGTAMQHSSQQYGPLMWPRCSTILSGFCPFGSRGRSTSPSGPNYRFLHKRLLYHGGSANCIVKSIQRGAAYHTVSKPISVRARV